MHFICCYMFNGLASLACYHSELTSETMKPFRRFGSTSWMGDQPIAKPLPAQDDTTYKDAVVHSCCKRDSNSRSQFSSVQDPICLRLHGHWDRHITCVCVCVYVYIYTMHHLCLIPTYLYFNFNNNNNNNNPKWLISTNTDDLYISKYV
jgi:hypothetical protein